MDFVNKVVGGGNSQTGNQQQQQQQQQEGEGQSSGGFMGKLNSMAGGGKDSEKNEDALDKGASLNA